MADGLTPFYHCSRFEESEDATRDARIKAQRDRDYYDEKQWTSDEEKTLKDRKQPVVTYNRIKRKVNALLGLEKQNRKDPKGFPREPGDEQSAQAATDAIRYVCDDSRWDDRRSEAFKELCIEGTAIIMVGAKKTKNGIDPEIRRIAWDRFYADPHSSEFDFSDAAYMGIVTWTDVDRAKRLYPGKEEVIEQTWASARGQETYDDKPKHKLWADYGRKRVRICEEYYLGDNGWEMCHFTQGGYLVDPMPSPYQDEEGKPENPLKAVSLYLDRDNNRYGEVRTMIGPQDEINKRRSKALHLITMRQARVSRGAGIEAEKVRKELAKPDGVFVADSDDFEILPTNDMAAANLQMLQEAKAEIDLLGPNAALQGKNEQDLSGRAIIAQQQGGMIEAATLMDRVRCLSLMTYRSVWARIRQYWTAERWIRVTDDERNLRFVGLNRPRTALEIEAEKLGINAGNFQQFVQQAPEQAQAFMAFAQSPQAQQAVVENNIAELDVDIILDEGVDTPTIAAEQFDQMIKLAGTGVVPIPPDVLIEASSLRDKGRLLEMLKQQNQVDPMMQQMKQLQVEDATANIEKTKSETMKNLAAVEDSDPTADLELKRAELAGKQQIEREKHEHGMAMAEQKQQFGMEMQAKAAAQRPQERKAA